MGLGKVYRSPPDPDAQFVYLPEIKGALFSPNEAVRHQARYAISFAKDGDAARIMNDVLPMLNEKSSKEQQIQAIRALGALGRGARPALEKVREFVKRYDEPLSVAAAAAMMRMVGEREYRKLLIQSIGHYYGVTMPDDNTYDFQKPGGQQRFEEFSEAVDRETKEIFSW
jgi:hypothetical protein